MSSKKNRRTLGDLLGKSVEQSPAKMRRLPRPQEEGLRVRSLSLTPAASELLDGFSREASEELGRRISASAVVRVLLHWADRNEFRSSLKVLLDAEINTGDVVWGRRGSE